MNNVHQKRFKKTKFYKNYTIPIVLFLDQIGLLSFFIPLVNKLIKFVGIKKRFNSKLNYRIYADSFEGAFSSQEEKPSKTALFFFTMGSESSFLLRQLIIAKYLESLNWKVEFLVQARRRPGPSHARRHPRWHAAHARLFRSRPESQAQQGRQPHEGGDAELARRVTNQILRVGAVHVVSVFHRGVGAPPHRGEVVRVLLVLSNI